MNNDILTLTIWLLVVKGQDVLDQYDSNFDQERFDEYSKKYPGLENTLSLSFNFRKTEEGHNYWNDIDRDFRKYCESLSIPTEKLEVSNLLDTMDKTPRVNFRLISGEQIKEVAKEASKTSLDEQIAQTKAHLESLELQKQREKMDVVGNWYEDTYNYYNITYVEPLSLKDGNFEVVYNYFNKDGEYGGSNMGYYSNFKNLAPLEGNQV